MVENKSVNFIDNLIASFGLKNDAALAKELDVAPPVISKIRHGKLKVGATMIIRIHEVFGISIAQIRRLLA